MWSKMKKKERSKHEKNFTMIRKKKEILLQCMKKSCCFENPKVILRVL